MLPRPKAFFLVLFCSIYAAARIPEIHKEVQQVYSFQPHLLSQEQIRAHSAELDKFWGHAKANQSVYISGLRAELADFKNPPFFLFDGSMLLLQLSDTEQDRKIAIAAIAHCDLRDVRDDDYFHWVHRLGTEGDDTTAAAFRILENPKFQVFVPQHALTLGQNYALVYMLLPTEQDFWIAPAINRLKIEKDITAQKSLLLLLWYAQTDSADQAIHELIGDSSRTEEVRRYAQELAARKANSFNASLTAPLASDAAIRKQRQVRMRSVSDEALIDLDQLTLKLLTLRKK